MNPSPNSRNSDTIEEENPTREHSVLAGKNWRNVDLKTFTRPVLEYPYVKIDPCSPYVQEAVFQQDPRQREGIKVVPVNDKKRVDQIIEAYNAEKVPMPLYRADITFRMIFKYKIDDTDSLPTIQRKLTQQLEAAQRLEDWEAAGKVKIVNRDPKMFDILSLPEVFEEVFTTQGISWTSYAEVGYLLALKSGGKDA